jgi:hypothetical protein
LSSNFPPPAEYDVAAEKSETSINTLIERRHDQRAREEGSERRAEERWQESVRRHEEKLRAGRLEQWRAYPAEQAERHRTTLKALIAHHEAEAERLKGA